MLYVDRYKHFLKLLCDIFGSLVGVYEYVRIVGWNVTTREILITNLPTN